MKKKLDINLLKNNNLTYTKKDVSYDTYDNIIKYNLDDVVNTLELLEDGVIFTRENDEYLFNLKLSKDQNTCRYLLKELDSYIDIVVDDGQIIKEIGRAHV